MKVLLLQPPIWEKVKLSLPVHAPALGILYLSSQLERHGYEVIVIDAEAEKITYNVLREKILKISPEVIGITFTTLMYAGAKETARIIKQTLPETLLIAGGTHFTILPEETMIDIVEIDIGVIGEGEYTLIDVLKTAKTNLSEVKGIIFRRNGQIIKTPPRGRIKGLDKIPFPDRRKLPIYRYKFFIPIFKGPVWIILGSRGCPFSCSFCSNPVFQREVFFRQPSKIVDEIETLIESFGARQFFFYDDNININLKWLNQICDEIITRRLNKRILWAAQAHLGENYMQYELLRKMKKAGCKLLMLSVESGSTRVLKSIGKHLTIEDVERGHKFCRQVGIKTFLLFMVGNLEERKEDLLKSLELIKRLSPDYCTFHIATPQPGSRHWEVAKAKGWLGSLDLSEYNPLNYSAQPISKTDGFSSDELGYWYKKLSYETERFLNRRRPIKNIILPQLFHLVSVIKNPIKVIRFFKRKFSR